MTWRLLDYGVGNLHSLRKALEACGAATDVTTVAEDLRDADVAVLPGVGSFGHVMEAIGDGAQVLRERHDAGHPIFGVCIGHQALYEASDEAPGTRGLGILSGRVRRLATEAGKIPHMGWNTLETGDGLLVDGSHVYYVHSYAAPPGRHTVATTAYGTPFSAADRAGNTVGFQFHPEKSGPVGLAILRRTVRYLEGA